eukprot:1538198-Prorocentrum_lima.AAC.1
MPSEVARDRSLPGVLLFAATWTRPVKLCRASLAAQRTGGAMVGGARGFKQTLSLIHISEPTRLDVI